MAGPHGLGFKLLHRGNDIRRFQKVGATGTTRSVSFAWHQEPGNCRTKQIVQQAQISQKAAVGCRSGALAIELSRLGYFGLTSDAPPAPPRLSNVSLYP